MEFLQLSIFRKNHLYLRQSLTRDLDYCQRGKQVLTLHTRKIVITRKQCLSFKTQPSDGFTVKAMPVSKLPSTPFSTNFAFLFYWKQSLYTAPTIEFLKIIPPFISSVLIFNSENVTKAAFYSRFMISLS